MSTPETAAESQFGSGPYIIAAVLVSVGAILATVGAVIGSRAALFRGVRYLQDVQPTASDIARTKWGQLQAAGSAGADAWRKTTPPA
jgi:hypothetical protein